MFKALLEGFNELYNKPELITDETYMKRLYSSFWDFQCMNCDWVDHHRCLYGMKGKFDTIAEYLVNMPHPRSMMRAVRSIEPEEVQYTISLMFKDIITHCIKIDYVLKLKRNVSTYPDKDRVPLSSVYDTEKVIERCFHFCRAYSIRITKESLEEIWNRY